jgi:hypothetical protein
MTRYVEMRMQYEEEKTSVQQLTEMLDEARANFEGSGGIDRGGDRLAATVVELRKSLGE